jgi:16S rRNA (adenine1518-N6/adenine1519-N6)-dimethyltransferase
MSRVLGHTARKRFGQNFLHDNNIIQKIIQAINPLPQQHVLEIGPGLGALTYALLSKLDHLDAIEIDRDLSARLQADTAIQNKLCIHEQDALKFDFATLNKRPLRLVGNLPYNISTPLIFHCLAQSECFADMHFMLQKEVVERICAAPNTDAYGRLSVMVQHYCTPHFLFTVPASAFRPQPKVESAIVRLIPHQQRVLTVEQEIVFAQLVKQGFSQRRKTLRNVLKEFISATALATLNIDAGSRVETLTVHDFVAITQLISRL